MRSVPYNRFHLRVDNAYVFESVGFGRVWLGRVRIGEGVYDIDTWELTRSSRFDIRIRGFGAS